jgi:hypothetical protein
MITAEENKKFGDFIEEQIKILKVVEFDNQDLIWHYTTGDALLSIVENGSLYATQVSCLNDSTEIRYGANLLRDAVMNIKTDNIEERRFLDSIVKVTVEESVAPTNLPSAWFVTCFSKEKDDLSQWRAYSGGENGYAIAFLAGGFFNRGSIVARVNYSEDEHKQVAANVARAMMSFFMEGLNARSTVESDAGAGDAWATEFLGVWERLVGRLAPMVKNPAFRGENEYRIVHELQIHEVGQLLYKQKQTLMSRHLPLVFPPLATRPSRACFQLWK